MNDTLAGLYEVVKGRQNNPQEGSYTCYLFEKGLDKILKKCGEECSEMIIAAKNQDNDELKNEISDLVYHVLVLMAERGLPLEDVQAVLEERRQKIGNLKKFHVSDHNT
ncbi:MAG TPA: phosphoribosyl-ATP diphosphatase [Candidatus Faecivivens stercoripullorum]|uniref:Phosphoribosyl-ATP pyrophosphatase n=1 Tax=Candidatus Faecivivens stercoripullorum TaxID=2840805 RepID=A0A9D1H6V3_9FIRM|nr:phosphoribosyl-ATP diphosphatase [Candidatus Faecivivens stercoripullorum]